jgi:glycosyltransferase involved in cell wall biosynthesis
MIKSIRYSIILPVKNGGEYVKKSINSILRQELDTFNLIVLDNNTTDGATEWINSLKDNRINLYKSEKSIYCGYTVICQQEVHNLHLVTFAESAI